MPRQYWQQQLNHGDMVNVPAYTAIHPRISGIFAVYFTMARRCAAHHRGAVDRTPSARRAAAAIPSFERTPLRGYATSVPPASFGLGVAAVVPLNCAPLGVIGCLLKGVD
jgi:hypothetical protein